MTSVGLSPLPTTNSKSSTPGRVVMNDTCDRLMHSKDIQEFYLGAKEEGARGERRWKKKKTWR